MLWMVKYNVNKTTIAVQKAAEGEGAYSVECPTRLVVLAVHLEKMGSKVL